MEKVFILGGARTPIGKYGGSLREVPAYKLAALALNEAVKRVGIKPERAQDVIMGQSYQNGECSNGARMALLEAGWPEHVTGITIDRRCCSGLEAVAWAAMKIQSGNAHIVVAGGMENMSQAEMYIPGEIRWGLGGRTDKKFGFMPTGHGAMSMWGIPFFDRIQRGRVMSQPIERYGELNSMMTWAEEAAKRENISRQDADAWAFRSHQKAVASLDAGKLKEEIVPVPLPQRKGESKMFDVDETPRRDTQLEKLSKLPAIYPGGVCTAGNSSSENDGAAAIVLMSESKVNELGVSPMACFLGAAVAGADPTLTYPAVPDAVNKALQKVGLSIDQIDLMEIQEAFAVQVLADAKLMGIKPEDYDRKINVNGSGISLGHPVGATGAMRLITLMYEMRRRGARYGMVAICGGGGHGIAGIIEAV